jgi:hippurate hydrolase
LVRFKEHWSGTLVLVAQPAEERMLGARGMLADGLFTRFPKPDCCLGLHVSPTLSAGTVGLVEGHAFANVDSVDILVRGVGGHGAFPQAAKDPVVLAAELVLALQTIISRETSPLEPAVITVGSIHGGAQRNVIPDAVSLQLTVRSFSQEIRARLLHAIKRTARGLAAAAGLPKHCAPMVTVSDESTPAVCNDPALTQRLRDTFEWWLGKANVLSPAPVMGGEDFARYGRTEETIPLCFYWLGAVSPARLLAANQADQPLPSLHSPRFAPEPLITIQTGVIIMAAAVLEMMPKATD